jgi:glycosyltransferase involved in cell wall biosynthesis
MTRRLISVISPCYNEEDNVEACYDAVRTLFETDAVLRNYDFEHIFADNSSNDRTVEKLRVIAARDPRVRIIVNARNYGPFRSTFNALRRARGDAVVPMLPVDLQDPPELIPEFVKRWEQGFLRVYGIRTRRHEGFLMRFVRRRYYWVVNRFSNIEIPENVAEFQIIDRQILDALLRFKDYYPYIRGMLANIGFAKDSSSIEYTWRERRSGLSKNRLFNLIDQGLNGMISFTNAPMRVAIFTGFGMAGLSFIYGTIQLIANLIDVTAAPPGIATLIVALFFLSGVQLALLGVLGEYISAIHFQVRQGDVVVEREVINMERRDSPPIGGVPQPRLYTTGIPDRQGSQA